MIVFYTFWSIKIGEPKKGGVFEPCLQHREAEGASADTDDVVVNGRDNELEELGVVSTGEWRSRRRQGSTEGSGNSRGRSLRDDGDVGKLAVVSGAHRVEADEVKRVRVHVVASVERDDRRVVVRVDKREVVRAHLRETISVLVDKRGLEDRVSRTRRREVGLSTRGDRRGGHVVRPLVSLGTVAHGEEENLDRMREAHVEGLLRISARGEGLARCSLHLLNEDVTRGTGHALTLVVGDNSVVSPHLGSTEDGRHTGGQVTSRNNSRSLLSNKGVINHNKEVAPVTESKVNSHLVIRKGRRRERNTAVPAVEERKREVEREGREHRLGATSGASNTLSHGVEVTNHVVVAVTLAGRHSEGCPEVQVVAVEASSHKVIKRDAALADDIVHKVARPPKSSGSTSGSHGVSALDLRGLETKPGVEQVITSTRNAACPFLVEGRRARGARQDNRDLGEPRGLTRLTNEIGGSVRATIEVLLNLVEGRKIDKAGGYIGCADRCHFY